MTCLTQPETAAPSGRHRTSHALPDAIPVDHNPLNQRAATGLVPSCATTDPEVFHSTAPTAITFAKTLCAHCPLQQACRTWARQHREWGLWGGETSSERAAAGFPPLYFERPGYPRGSKTLGELRPCGTPAAYRRHLRAGEEPCERCREAELRRQAQRRPLAA
ncbi:WhiB family transcriptional regulator [Streptomyces sp. N35]|uniref:WhiB family transcriptional regulator n=1 Tax=Streptomyces sp. N35 TaxID=2795730 RepID=UPI0018F690C0